MKKKILISVLAIIAVAVIGLIIWFSMKGKDDTTDSKNTVTPVATATPEPTATPNAVSTQAQANYDAIAAIDPEAAEKHKKDIFKQQ